MCIYIYVHVHVIYMALHMYIYIYIHIYYLFVSAGPWLKQCMINISWAAFDAWPLETMDRNDVFASRVLEEITGFR